jgi:hypothetical protein
MPALRPPPSVNPHAIDLWFEACTNLPQDPRLARAEAMRKYVSLCDSAGLSVFADPGIDPNIAIRNFLGKRRRLYVRYVELSKFFDGVRIRKITKDAYPTDYGFAIRVEGWVSTADPRWFAKIKTTPGWRFSLAQDKQHRHYLKLDPGITVYVRNPNLRSPVSWYVGYEIHCPITPNLKDFKSETMLRVLWDTLAATVRPRGTLPQRRL